MESSTMDSNVSLYEDTLKFYFVQIGDEPFEEIRFAREKLSENVGELNIIDTNSRECARFLENVTKKDIFVLSKFSGDVFDKLRETDALVIGPQCVISCFMDNEMVPNNNSPVFTMAMRNLIISLSAFSLAKKRELKKLIGFMGGRCIDQFTENVTHLVTDKVITTKYEQAAIQKKKIMKSDWVKDVWAKSVSENVLATDEMFDRHRVPVFYNLAMTTTGLREKVKLDVKRVIEENGGRYYGEFSTNKINILLLDLKPKESPKWKAAVSSDKSCLIYAWIYESVQAGFALPYERYRVESVSKPIASTPEKRLRTGNHSVANFNSTNASMVSNVSCANVINETNVSQFSVGSVSGRESEVGETTSPLHRITLQDAKKAGLFLDGCNIYACGFASDEKEKIWKILNSGGATRYDTINSNVSHILVGKPTKADVALLQAVKNDAVMLKMEWLVESIAKKTAIMDYERFLYRLSGGTAKSADAVEETSSAPSPASKRNILSMTGNSAKPANRRRLDFQNNEEPNKGNTSIASELSRTDFPIDENMENLILDQYMNASVNKDKSMFKVPAPVAVAAKDAPQPLMNNYVPMNPSEQSIDFEDSSVMTDSETEYNFLQNKTVYIHGFDEESIAALVHDCELGGATVITDNNSKHVVDYMILALDILSMHGIKVKARNIVNHHWLLNAKKLNKPTEIPYFFKPIFFSEEFKPLSAMIIVFSTYSGDERTFLAQLAEILGAEVQDSYRKVARPLLICPTRDNRKYDAAIKWNLPVVTCEWLLACYKYAKRLPVQNFLVGDSISPVDDLPDTENIPVEPEPQLNPIEHVVEEVPQRMLNAVATPVNPRISSLRPSAADQRAPKTPTTSAAAARDNENDDFLNSFNALQAENVREALNDSTSDTGTPDLKRVRYEVGDRATPEYARTPYLLEQKRQFLEERRNRYKPTESELKNKKKSTPWTEYKRRFWKEALGDAYESPSQYPANTQAFTQVNATVASSGRRLVYDTSAANADLEADANIRKLDAFIKNRENAADVPEAIPDSAPRMHELDFPNTELPEIVGWGDPDQRRSNNGMRFRGTPHFSISMAKEAAKMRILDQIRNLNGRVCENLTSYDKMCSHLLCDRPNRGEKTCCSIASGKWVLSTEYVQKSIENGRFLDEELFEWGNPKAVNNLPALTEQEEPFAKAAYRLRVRMETTATGVFKDLCAIVRTSRDENLRNLIEAGHGKVLNDNKSKPLSAQKDLLASATHLILQPKFANLSSDDVKAIRKSKVICVQVNFLNACITTDTENFPLDPEKYLIKM